MSSLLCMRQKSIGQNWQTVLPESSGGSQELGIQP